MELNGWTSPQMLRRYGASARSARARRSYDRIMEDTPQPEPASAVASGMPATPMHLHPGEISVQDVLADGQDGSSKPREQMFCHIAPIRMPCSRSLPCSPVDLICRK